MSVLSLGHHGLGVQTHHELAQGLAEIDKTHYQLPLLHALVQLLGEVGKADDQTQDFHAHDQGLADADEAECHT